MIQAMYSAISGMKAFKGSLDVIGNNIANVDTTAYKSGKSTFQEALSQTLKSASAPGDGVGGTNASQIGLGVITGAIVTNQTQGSLTPTGKPTDAAIQGNGYFVLSDGARMCYTRDGALTTDGQNNLVSLSSGLKVLGWMADSSGNIDTASSITSASTINIPIGSLSFASQTTEVELSGNLDLMTDNTWDLSFDINDSIGVRHNVKVNFTKSATDAGVWDYTVSCPDTSATPGDPATTVVASGSMSFDTGGASQLGEIPISLNFADDNGSTQPVDFTIRTSGITQIESRNGSTVKMNSENGFPYGTLNSFGIDSNGVITGTFTNGATRPLGQIALTLFNNPAGLVKTGNGLLSEGANSGTARIGVAGVGGLGSISSGFLEASNVDLSTEFANMIITQRAFQANSKIITVSDEVLENLVNLKR